MDVAATFHHVGVACRDLDQEKMHWYAIGYVDDGNGFIDPNLGVKGIFLIGGGPRVELLSPLTKHSKVLSPWLERGIKMYHMAFEVDSLPKALQDIDTKGGRTVIKPIPAVAFGGRQIAFCLLRNLMLIEFIQR